MHLTKKTTTFVYRSTCLLHFTMLAPTNIKFESLHVKFQICRITFCKISSSSDLIGQMNDQKEHPLQWSGRFLGITRRDPSVCKSNQLHVGILRFSFIKSGYIPWIPLKWWVILLQSWTSTGYFSNSASSSVSNCRFSPIVDPLYQYVPEFLWEVRGLKQN